MNSPNSWELRSKEAIHWLRRSISATGGNGSAHSWHPLLGWSKPYPETTGYIIPTLFDYAKLHQDPSLSSLAFDCADWLTTIQLPDGAFAGLLLGNTQPSVFNSSQILFGLSRAVQENPNNTSYWQALERCCNWLMALLTPEYSWEKYAYVPGFIPSYYSQAVWGVLSANEMLQNRDITQNMQSALRYYASRFNVNHTVRDWGFKPGEAAFTHTIAYTLHGFLACAVILQDNDVLQKTVDAADALLAVRSEARGRTAGRYTDQWQGDYSFICLSGNAQLSVFFQHLFDLTGAEKYRLAASGFLAEIVDFQKLSGNPNRVGGLPGSAPMWGAYLPFRYPNWAVKFFLDAIAPYQKGCH